MSTQHATARQQYILMETCIYTVANKNRKSERYNRVRKERREQKANEDSTIFYIL